MQKIIVASVSTKPTKNGGTLYTITDEKGSKFSGFHESLGGIQQGSTIDADVEVSGKFNNIKEWKLLTPATAETIIRPTSAASRAPEDRTSIERQVCLKCACEIHGGADSVETILENAGKMFRWLAGKCEPKTDVKSTSSDQAFEKLESAGTSVRHFNNEGEFLTASWKEKHLSKSDVLLKLGVSKLGDLDEAWKQLAG